MLNKFLAAEYKEEDGERHPLFLCNQSKRHSLLSEALFCYNVNIYRKVIRCLLDISLVECSTDSGMLDLVF